MKEMFEPHRQKLTNAERQAIWRKISGSPARKARPRLRWGLSTSAAALAAAVIAFVVFQREPASPPRSILAADDTITFEGERISPDAIPVEPGTDRTRAGELEVRRPEPKIVASHRDLQAPPPVTHEKAPAATGAASLEEPLSASARVSPEASIGEGEEPTVEKHEIEVTSEKLIADKTSTAKPQASGETLSELPVENLEEAAIPKPNPVAQGPTRGGEVESQVDRVDRLLASDDRGAQETGTITGRVTEGGGKRPVSYANVVLPELRRGGMAGVDGTFTFAQIPVGTYEIRAMMVGRDPVTKSVTVVAGQTVHVDLDLGNEKITKQLEEVVITAEKQIDTKTSTSKHQVSGKAEHGDALSGVVGKTPEKQPVEKLEEAVALKAGVVASGGELHFRGGRGGEVTCQTLPAPERAAGRGTPPVIPITGGTALPNDEPYDAMFFRHYGVNPFIPTEEDSLSTFAVDVDAASYTIARRYIELGNLPPADAVRVEEFINFFPQGYPKFEDDDFRILIDGAPSPFGPGYHLLRIGLKGREIQQRDRKPAQLTFVIDVSGSMKRENRLGLVKQALRLLVDQLRHDDRIGIVVYGTRGWPILEPTAVGEATALRDRDRSHPDEPGGEELASWPTGRQRILDAIDCLQAEGSTNAEEGLLLGYEMARRGFRPGAINRIVLCSDGVANEGRTGSQSILERVRNAADRGIHLSAIGFGMGNYNDVLMEQLANNADGNYYYVDDLGEARRVLVENLTGTLQTIAKDAKIQVEFHPSRVLRYRLLGFENRDVGDRDFRNDKVDAGEIGAGHEVTALYEVKLAPHAKRGPLATVRLRYARPEHDAAGAPEVREMATEFRSTDLSRRFEKASPYFRLDAAVAEFAEILRGSYWAKESRLSDVLPVARRAARDLREDAAAEFVVLVEKAAQQSGTSEPEEVQGSP